MGEPKNRFEMLDKLLKEFGWPADGSAEAVLDAVVKAMSDADFQSIYDYICRMHSIGLDGN